MSPPGAPPGQSHRQSAQPWQTPRRRHATRRTLRGHAEQRQGKATRVEAREGLAWMHTGLGGHVWRHDEGAEPDGRGCWAGRAALGCCVAAQGCCSPRTPLCGPAPSIGARPPGWHPPTKAPGTFSCRTLVSSSWRLLRRVVPIMVTPYLRGRCQHSRAHMHVLHALVDARQAPAHGVCSGLGKASRPG